MKLIGDTRSFSLNVTQLHGKIVIQFSRDIAELTLSPQEAAELSKAIADQTMDLIKREYST